MKIRMVIERSSSVPNRRPAISCSTSGSTHVALINGTFVSAQKQSIQCFVGIKMRQNATYSCQMFQHQCLLHQKYLNEVTGRHLSGQANGSLVAEHFKSLLLLYQSNYSLVKVRE